MIEMDEERRLDRVEVTSMDYRQLAALVDTMKKYVMTAKRNVINKLTRKIKILKKKKNFQEEEEAGNAKVDKIKSDIAIIKEFGASRVSKFALACEESLDQVSRRGNASSQLICLTRLAEEKSLKLFVDKWRKEHADWRVLANFLLSKNTSRHFKRSEQKHRVTEQSLLVEKELLRQRLKTGSEPVDINEPLVERTSKGKKFKKKGRNVDIEDASPDNVNKDDEDTRIQEEINNSNDSSDDEMSPADNPSDDDLYTFNIIDDDINNLAATTQDSGATPKPPDVQPKQETTQFANKLFSSRQKELQDLEDENSSEESGEQHTIKEVKGKRVKKSANELRKLGKSSLKPGVVVESGEMVKAALDIEQLCKSESSEIAVGESTASTGPKSKTRRKKSAFFMGGDDEIDYSLGTNEAEQNQARKNFKSNVGYKGIKESDKSWMKSVFTESLRPRAPKKSSKFSTDVHASNKKDFRSGRRQDNSDTSKEKSDSKALKRGSETLHPSWEASKRRKEQQELVKNGPQNKKITFDD